MAFLFLCFQSWIISFPFPVCVAFLFCSLWVLHWFWEQYCEIIWEFWPFTGIADNYSLVHSICMSGFIWACPSMSECAWVSSNESECVLEYSSVSQCAWGCPSVSECARVCLSVCLSGPGCAWVCLSVSECVQVCLRVRQCVWVCLGLPECIWVFVSVSECVWAWSVSVWVSKHATPLRFFGACHMWG